MRCHFYELAFLAFGVLLSCLPMSAQSDSAAICLAPNAGELPVRCSPGLCGSGNLSLKIDNRDVLPWPKTPSKKIVGHHPQASHRIVIYRAGKPQQSFKFDFSRFKSNTACLFLNDLYWTAQLWDPKSAPWCKCK
jgi:hypothetical protein